MMQAVLIMMVLASCAWAGADGVGWLGFRGDGTGVAAGNVSVDKWSPNENILWKAQVPGRGNSSPVVAGDKIFLTSAAPTRSGVVMRRAALWVALGCALVAVWLVPWGSLGDPLGRRRAMRSTVVGRLATVLIFFAVGWSTVTVCEIAREKVPQLGGKKYLSTPWVFERVERPDTWTLIVPIHSVFRVFRVDTSAAVNVSPTRKLPRDVFIAGGAATLVVLLVNSAWLWRRRGRQEPSPADDSQALPGDDKSRHSAIGNVLSWCLAMLAALAIGWSTMAVTTGVMVGLPDEGFQWYVAGCAMCLSGLAMVGVIAPGSGWRWAMGIIVVAGLFSVAWFSPHNPVNGKWSMGTDQQYPIFAGLAVVAVGAFLIEWFFSRKSRRPGYRIVFGGVPIAAAIGLASAGLFATINIVIDNESFRRLVIALDQRSGEIAWQTPCGPPTSTIELHAFNSLATPTPTADGKHVYAHFGGQGLFCVDYQGAIKWDFPDPVEPSHWGSGSSPILWQNMVIMTYDVDHAALTVALQKQTGEVLWQIDRTEGIDPGSDLYDSYHTPVVMQLDGVDQLVNCATSILTGHDLKTGVELWRFEHPGSQIVVSPLQWKDLLIVLGGEKQPYMGAVKVTREGRIWSVERQWEVKKRLPKISTPVVYGDHIYMVSNAGVASCIEAATGREAWKMRLPGTHYASVLAADGKVWFTNTIGTTTVIAAEPELNKIASNEIDQPVYASLAVTDDDIILRSTTHLYRIGAAE